MRSAAGPAPGALEGAKSSAIRRWLVLAVPASLVVLSLLMAWQSLTVDPFAPDVLPFWLAGGLAVGLHVAWRQAAAPWRRMAADFAGWAGVLMILVVAGATATYPLAALSHGSADRWLAAIDRALGFDWNALYRLVADHPLLQLADRIAYQSIYVTAAVLLGYFAASGKRDEAHAFLFTFWVAAVVTLILFPLMPAAGPLAYLWHGPVPYMPESALWQPELIAQLRAHAVHVVDLGALRGLVSAPSFHAEIAILFIVAAWPHRALRVPFVVVNTAVLLATPIEGTHYLSDMLIGAAVAVVAVLAVRSATARSG